jgi:hypothetical protein
VSFSTPSVRLGEDSDVETQQEEVMKRYLLLYKGPVTPPGASHEGWPEWFAGIGEALVDAGSPMVNGFVVQGDGSVGGDPAYRNGYSVIQAEDRDRVADVLKDHPFLGYGPEYTIEVFEIPKR